MPWSSTSSHGLGLAVPSRRARCCCPRDARAAIARAAKLKRSSSIGSSARPTLDGGSSASGTSFHRRRRNRFPNLGRYTTTVAEGSEGARLVSSPVRASVAESAAPEVASRRSCSAPDGSATVHDVRPTTPPPPAGTSTYCDSARRVATAERMLLRDAALSSVGIAATDASALAAATSRSPGRTSTAPLAFPRSASTAGR